MPIEISSANCTRPFAKITEDFESRWHFNTSISGIMELVNDLYAEEARPLRRDSR